MAAALLSRLAKHKSATLWDLIGWCLQDEAVIVRRHAARALLPLADHAPKVTQIALEIAFFDDDEKVRNSALKASKLAKSLAPLSLKVLGLTKCLIHFGLKVPGLLKTLVPFGLKDLGLTKSLAAFGLNAPGLATSLVPFSLKAPGLTKSLVPFDLKDPGLTKVSYSLAQKPRG